MSASDKPGPPVRKTAFDGHFVVKLNFIVINELTK
jgi:hypothetical protein